MEEDDFGAFEGDPALGEAIGPDLQEVIAPPDAAGERLDKFLAEHFPALSRSRIKHLIEAARVFRNGEKELNPAAKVRAGVRYRLEIPPPEPAEPQPENIPLSILYEDAHVLVVDKPAGLSVHPAPGNWTGTLVNAVLWHAGESLKVVGATGRPGIVHRLDMDTSGVMVVCKSEFALASLGRQFQDRTISRRYRAFGVGQPKSPWPKSGRVEARLARDPRDRKRMAVVADTSHAGKPAMTNYETINRYGIGFQGQAGAVASEIACVLETGRTHQIRVHMAHIGMPLIGDRVYGDTRPARALQAALPETARLTRQALHAETLAFTHPATSERLAFQSELPEDLKILQAALKAL
ncbi:ribosomal large subunit pseudouridine synthase D [Candidatus Phycosocius bacilliformis]|uniref:Pseudouridine synthase n=1 Tax=Candidatus Phycosocius bacilliformis TaxID=1445552 RepID=A0A2P2EAG1_9PROT|nr:RluA family pseudouridine synthase [Candidatus Phycosocius bacilliformis]GBF58067.1 ribosomal large subunit pseudouridine synthase D [Candidatus Phycosocius bacilliformis]